MTDYAVINPATGETLASFDTFTDAQIEAAVAAADEAHREWSRSSTVAERAALLRRAAELHRERREELADVFVREMGKPREAALGEVDFAADIAEYYADQAEAIMADQPIAILGEGSAIVRRSSLGPLVGIMPWNFPAYQIVRFAAPNLIVGNTILLKPAPQCPESSTAIEAIYHDAGFPTGAYQNVLATNEQIADMIADPRVQGVSLTGSERAGAAVAEIAGRNLKKVALELGGSDPFIVLSTDDLDATVQAGVDARLDNNGQACNGAKRFIIVDDLYDSFVEKFTAAMASVQATDPTLDDTVLGPVSSETAAENLQKQIDQAVEQGATLLTGGTRDGAFFAPTVLADVTPDMNVYREELFGPAAVVYRVADEDAAVALANDTTFGLGSYVFTTDAEQAERVADNIEAGMVYVNLVLADSPELPFGGIKRSGTSRELGHLAADEFVNKKLIRIG
ncbi:succinate-semialdehyde dehydrogenase [Microbacterium sp. 1.5R]|uniref:NAD-dependent succinate-semialdehyde dehydrogenase n=1 Tax=unclassified Microbacterium TaxID=2609290 RepID=UPI0006F1CD15|nr:MULTISPECIES: NAD-dependent succinate-semialdehyde dehydrogenase [unclassified Microbacterium]APH45744.1 succinate-semialdehyde dehydrogenase [Microbacterium sp. 1.5R]KRD50772.1 succinate-semialdehyde dehydrogenase [Microbacterium sp. Root280D1]MBC6495941.1 succinate-semialdehyde dehydrogenase [Microbacterium sp. 4-7]